MTSPLFRSLRHLGFALLALFVFIGAARAHAPDEANKNGIPAKGYAVMKAGGVLEPFEFKRRPVGDNDVLIEILYSGICHSDIHHARGEWGQVNYPIVPGHEIVGRVAQVGKNVTRFKVGDFAGVGCMVDSCGACAFCMTGKEQYCVKGATFTYGRPGVYGGYSTSIVVTQKFALRIPEGIPLEQAAPLLCAGITTYSPLKAVGIRKGQQVAVAGMGGLGHMAVQYAKAMGAVVTVLEITGAKEASARELGATYYINTAKSKDVLDKERGKYDVIISTIPARYELGPYINALKPQGTLVLLGLPPAGHDSSDVSIRNVIVGGKKIAGSLIGGIAETQEMLNFSAKMKIYAKVEVIPIQHVNEAYNKIIKGDVQYRYVIDMASLE